MIELIDIQRLFDEVGLFGQSPSNVNIPTT